MLFSLYTCTLQEKLNELSLFTVVLDTKNFGLKQCTYDFALAKKPNQARNWG
jgi:hypothetical protein